MVSDLKTHPVSVLGCQKMFIKLHHQPSANLIMENVGRACGMVKDLYSFFYLLT